MDSISLIAGLVVGAASGWFAASGRSQGLISELRSQIDAFRESGQAKDRAAAQLQQQVRAESEERIIAATKLQELQAATEEYRKLLDKAEERLRTTFDSLASGALQSNREAFLALARTTFEKLQADAKGELDQRKVAVEGLVQPLRDSLSRFEHEVQAIERSRTESYAALNEQVKALNQTTSSLNHALRTPNVRGRWGEMTLRRVAELAGMSEHCDFQEQESLPTETSRQRPDMVVHLPAMRRIAVDAKAPLQAFLDAYAAPDEEERRKHLARHGKIIREHMNKLSARAYWDQFDPAPDFVVLFLPGEHFFSAALEHEPTLIEDGMESRIVLATPTTLIALLRAVAYGWRQERLAHNAQEISNAGKELYDRIHTFLEHLRASGAALDKAVECFNRSVGSLEGRVLISARRLRELGVTSAEELEPIAIVERTARQLQFPDEPSDH